MLKILILILTMGYVVRTLCLCRIIIGAAKSIGEVIRARTVLIILATTCMWPLDVVNEWYMKVKNLQNEEA